MGRFRDMVIPSAGLTTATTAYTSGDVLGGLMTATFNQRGACSIAVTSLVITDASAVIGATDLYLFNATLTPAANNAAFAPSDAELATLIGVLPAATVYTHAGNKAVTWGFGSEEVPLYLPEGILYMVAVTRTANAVFAAGATSLNFRLGYCS